MIDTQVASSCRETAHLIERLEHDANVRMAVLRGEQFLEFTLTTKPTADTGEIETEVEAETETKQP